MLLIHFLLLIFILLLCECKEHKIVKRHLLFPRTTVLQFTYGLSVPLILPKRSINLSLACQTNYDLPWSLSQLHTKTISAKRNKEDSDFFDFSRETFYQYLIQLFDNFNLNGEKCLLRAICEIAEYPMYLQSNSSSTSLLLEEIVHFIFTPSLEIQENNPINFNNELLMAEKIGRRRGDCSLHYSECILSIVDLFTMKFIT